jgi:hypothetical protein
MRRYIRIQSLLGGVTDTAESKKFFSKPNFFGLDPNNLSQYCSPIIGFGLIMSSKKNESLLKFEQSTQLRHQLLSSFNNTAVSYVKNLIFTNLAVSMTPLTFDL